MAVIVLVVGIQKRSSGSSSAASQVLAHSAVLEDGHEFVDGMTHDAAVYRGCFAVLLLHAHRVVIAPFSPSSNGSDGSGSSSSSSPKVCGNGRSANTARELGVVLVGDSQELRGNRGTGI